jgi:hypothetical protein
MPTTCVTVLYACQSCHDSVLVVLIMMHTYYTHAQNYMLFFTFVLVCLCKSLWFWYALPYAQDMRDEHYRFIVSSFGQEQFQEQ